MNKVNTIIISGGSRGLGLDMAKHCLKEGFKVATFARKKTKEVEELVHQNKNTFLFEELNIKDHDSIQNFVAMVSEKMGPIYGLINNAAIGQDHLFAHIPKQKMDDIVQINLLGPIYLTRAVVKNMLLENTPGHIINISSICGKVGYKGLSVYSATKGALDAFTRSLGSELGERGIRVNSIAPGFFESEMSELLSESQINIIRGRTPTKKLVTSEDIIQSLDFIMKSRNVTCSTVYVDGGTIFV